MRILILTATAALMMTAAAGAEAELKFPNGFAYKVDGAGDPYFRCDYTTRTCLDGYYRRGEFVGTVLAEDRKTILRHVWCHENGCTNYSTGEVTTRRGEVRGYLQSDMPARCATYFTDFNWDKPTTPQREGCEIYIGPQRVK